MSTAILFKVLQTVDHREEAVGPDGPTANDLYVVLSEIRDGGARAAEETRVALDRLRSGITGDEDSSLVTQLQKLRTNTDDRLLGLRDATNSGFAQLSQEFHDFAQTVAENNSKVLIEALNEVIRDFNKNLTEQFGENFKHLNAAVEKLVVWQEQYRAEVEAVTAAFQTTQRGIDSVAIAVGQIAEKAGAIPETMRQLSAVLQAVDAQTQDLARHLEAFARLRENAGHAFPIIEQNLASLTGGVTKLVKEVSANIEAAVRSIEASAAQQHKLYAELAAGMKANVDHLLAETRNTLHAHQLSHEQLRKDYASLREQTTATLDSLSQTLNKALQAGQIEQKKMLEEHAAAMRDAVSQVRLSYERTLQQSAEALGKQVAALDEKMQEEVERIVTEMGTYLLSLSNRFVSDYMPLTDRLREIVRIAEHVDAR